MPLNDHRPESALLLAHNEQAVRALRVPSATEPLRILVSGCLAGLPCGVDGTDYGMGHVLDAILRLPTVSVLAFCPEHHGIGTPRRMPDIHGGDGFDVLDGRARVYDERGEDLTRGMIVGARAMLDAARLQRAEVAILTDLSAACGSQVISDGPRLVPGRRYRTGVGVATATLLRGGIAVVSQRDHRTLGRLREILTPGFVADPAAIDHHETAWFQEYFAPAHGEDRLP